MAWTYLANISIVIVCLHSLSEDDYILTRLRKIPSSIPEVYITLLYINFALPYHPGSQPLPLSVSDCRGIVKTLVCGMKTITWGAGSCKIPGTTADFCKLLVWSNLQRMVHCGGQWKVIVAFPCLQFQNYQTEDCWSVCMVHVVYIYEGDNRFLADEKWTLWVLFMQGYHRLLC